MNNRKKHSLRNGFFTTEVIFSIVAMALLAYIAFQATLTKRYEMDVDSTIESISQIIDKGIINAQTGYGKGTGGYCSASVGLYKDISAYRIFKCSEMLEAGVLINYAASVNDPTQRNGANSFFRFMTNYTNETLAAEEGCRVYFTEVTDMDKFKMFVNCSFLRTDNEKRRLESQIISSVSQRFSFYTFQIMDNALGITTDVGGTDKDGIFSIVFKN